MKLLILGYSNIVQRKVLPTARKVFSDEDIIISSRRDLSAEVLTHQFISGFDQALESSGADIVYISTINTEHAKWALRALECNLHVIVDKPAFMELEEAQQLVALARKKNLALVEATVFPFHPQIEAMKAIFSQLGSAPRKIQASFTMPAFDTSNFRYQRKSGGGALMDLGPYAVATARTFFSSKLKKVSCHQEHLTAHGDVDSGFSLMIEYEDDQVLLGHFVHGMEYTNTVTLHSNNAHLSLDRFFTTPDDHSNEAKLSTGNAKSIHQLPAGDSFEYFFRAIISYLESGDFEDFYQALLSDASTMNLLKKGN